MVDRYCEEFSCGISQALHDLENAPYALIMEVLDLRAFMRCKAQLDRAKKGGDGPTGPMSDRLWEAIQSVNEDRLAARLGHAPDGR